MPVFVGLDCGGSSTRVLAVNDQGEVLFQGQSGAANLTSTPENRLRSNLAKASAGCPRADYVCGCFAGLLNLELQQMGEMHLTQLFFGAKVRAEPDFYAALYSCPHDTDICVIAGTGSLVCSRHGDRVLKSGGRGYLLGDYGSGVHYGRAAVVHYLDHPKNASAELKEMVQTVFGSLDESIIVPMVYRPGAAPQLLGKMSQALLADAKAGDPYALESVDRNTGLLADVVARHVGQHLKDSTSLNVCLAGGVWKSANIVREEFNRHLSIRLPGREISLLKVGRPPVQGAVELAKEMSIGN